MQYKGNSNELLQIETITNKNWEVLNEVPPSALTLLWFNTNNNELTIDTIDYTFNKNQVLCLTEFHSIEINTIGTAKMIRFNRPFYCVIDHDSEVGCKGMLFFGAAQLPFFTIPTSELRVFETVYEMFVLEIQTKDNLQFDMLQMMLKQFLILCARQYKKQNNLEHLAHNNVDIIRAYNFLVEQHFKSKHTVADYAKLLNKSPKTLSNLFAKISTKTPLQYIHERKMLEAQRLLRYTDRSIKEIAYDTGFEDIQSFGRFVKKNTQQSPSEFREMK